MTRAQSTGKRHLSHGVAPLLRNNTGLVPAEAQYLPALDVAAAYARIGNNEKTLEWLEKSYAQRDGNLTLVKSYPEFKDIRKDPRFRDLLRRIGLPD